MGTKPQLRPQRLAEKLRYIREFLDLTQTELMRRLAVEEFATQSNISEFESGKRAPSLLILLQYARLAGVHVEDLIDDEADLPAKLPGKVKHARLKPAAAFRRKRR
ncbi:MAG TPA: helix-turn-helix transcriptional regulator [Pyrinomonadaceae bacterium]|jgi:transcriptional regulator with XRE-family HTH domain